MRLTTHTYAEKENRVGRMLQRAAFFILHSSFFILLMAACSSDDPSATGDNGQVVPPSETNGKLTLRIATHNDVTRAAWQDNNATDDEMMNLWVVVLTDASGNVQKSWACRPTAGSADQEIDEIAQIAKGTYKAYSFANISVANVCTLLGGLTEGAAVTLSSTPAELNISGTVSNAASKTATINGNGFDPTALDNGYGEKGIPMSNVQTISATDTEKDLIVVRMLAKIKLSIKNETGTEQYIKYATISNVTKNEDNNLKLFPNWTSTDGMDNMDVMPHGDLQPNLNGTPTTEEMTIPGIATAEALANDATREVTFYINECKKPTEFYLTIGLGDATNTNEYRYALISNNAANEWNYIARNDYRIIPIVIDDYKFELIPYDFPPIGVYPVSVREIDTDNHVFDFTFHDYGHFHLLPKVTKTSDNSIVEYSSATTPSGTAWTLNTNWEGSWFTAATKGGAWLDDDDITSNGFYRSDTGSTTADGDDEGQTPVWYVNDGVAGPQWDPAALGNYRPFIFGYIADPGSSMTEDKKIYHEMKIKLYVGGNYRRDMIYRFYMTLSKDQMLYAPRRADAPRRRH